MNELVGRRRKRYRERKDEEKHEMERE